MDVKSKNIIAVWIAVAVAVTGVILAGWWATHRHQPSAGALTVQEAINGGVPQDQSVDHSGDPAEQDRIVALAESLGIPSESVPREILSMSSDEFQSRADLLEELESAVKSGVLTEEEAQGALAAFDAGIMSPRVGPIVGESTPAE